MKNHRVKSNGLIPNSIKFISSCIKAVSANVRSSDASVSCSAAGGPGQQKDQVLWTCFDNIEFGPSWSKCVLLVGYSNGFQVLDVDNASSVSEIVSKRDDPVTFLQMQPIPAKLNCCEGFEASHPLLLVVAIDGSNGSSLLHGGVSRRDGLVREPGTFMNTPTSVRFYSLRSQGYVHVLRFRSTVYMVRCSSQVVAVGLASQIYCFDAFTLENKFSVLTYPIPQLGGHGSSGVNIGYGPMAVGTRWLAYASNNVVLSNTGRLSPQSLTPSPGVSPSNSPNDGNLVARFAMESSKQLASGLLNLGDMGYKTLSKYYQDVLTDGSSSDTSQNSSWGVARATGHSMNAEAAGTVIVKDIISGAVISQFRAHNSAISALCFDPSGTLLVTSSIHGHNINIFRIMPCRSKNESGILSYDWDSSHVHLYKLHRGMTSAVIQDICFSHYSQWIALVSSKGTCHLFILSPFGGETGLHVGTRSVDSCKIFPALSPPWWFTPSFSINRQPSLQPPPSPVTLSVVSRVKNCTGWLNTVNITSSSGKVSVPPGCIAVIFHSSQHSESHYTNFKNNTSEHLLVYSPSGHLVQYDLVASMGGEASRDASRIITNSHPQHQDGELHVAIEPIQCWDVCRRTDWLEKEVCLPGISYHGKAIENNTCERLHGEDTDLTNQSYRFISNAEVQISTTRMPIWRKPKVCFYNLRPERTDEQCMCEDYNSGESEIEKFRFHEIEIKRNEFASFDRLQSTRSSSTESSVCPLLKHVDRDKNFESHSLCSLQVQKAVPDGCSVNTPTSIALDCGADTCEKAGSNGVFDHEGAVQYLQQECYKLPAIDGSNDSADADSSSSPHGRDKSELDGDNDHLLGGVFPFCEEALISPVI